MKLPWKAFKKAIGPDLLPVVIDPKVEPASESSLPKDAIGKAPSIVTEAGARGIAGWSTKESTPEEIDKWSSDGRLGFGMRGNTLKAITISASTVAGYLAERKRVMTILAGTPTVSAPRSARRTSGIILFASDEDRRTAVTTATKELDFYGSKNFVVLSNYTWGPGLETRLQALVKSKKRVTAEQLAKVFP